MAITYNLLSDTTNNSVTKDCGTIRIMQVDTAGAALTGTGTDVCGKDGGSIYDMGNIEDVKWNNPGSIQTKIDLNGKTCALAFNEEGKSLEFNIIGMYNKFTVSGTLLDTVEKIVKSMKPFKMCWYDRADSVASYYIKRVWWLAYFEPNYMHVRKQGEFTMISVKASFLDLETATSDTIGSLGYTGQTKYVSAILALSVAETFDSQANIS